MYTRFEPSGFCRFYIYATVMSLGVTEKVIEFWVAGSEVVVSRVASPEIVYRYFFRSNRKAKENVQCLGIHLMLECL